MSPPSDFAGLINVFIGLILAIVPVIFGATFLVFFWGLAKFIFRIGGDEKALKEGKDLMKWGLIALFILTSVLSILSFVYNDFGFSRPFGFPLLPES